MQQAELSSEGRVEELDKVKTFARVEKFSYIEFRDNDRVKEMLNPVFARSNDFSGAKLDSNDGDEKFDRVELKERILLWHVIKMRSCWVLNPMVKVELIK